jgi:hypothetical protein
MGTLNPGLNRRNFIKTSAKTGSFLTTAGFENSIASCASELPVRIGFVNIGVRGMAIYIYKFFIKFEIHSVCDIVAEKHERAERLEEAAN